MRFVDYNLQKGIPLTLSKKEQVMSLWDHIRKTKDENESEPQEIAKIWKALMAFSPSPLFFLLVCFICLFIYSWRSPPLQPIAFPVLEFTGYRSSHPKRQTDSH